MVSELTLWDEDLESNDEETYQDLVRSIRRTNGFRLLFVRCNRGKNAQLIKNLTADLPQRKIQTLKIEEPIDNLYNRIAALPDLPQIDTLFIEGLEFSIFEYEDQEFKDINQRSKAAVYSGSTKDVPPLFTHLNMQRERFRDNFPICMIFLVPDFALNYFIRRSPDFFDWRSQTFRFTSDGQNIAAIASRILIEGDYEKYLQWTPQARVDRIIEIKDILNEAINSQYKAFLYFELGNILCADQRWESAIQSYDHTLAIKSDSHGAWNNRGIALHQSGRTEEAIESYDCALAIKSDSHEAWNNRGIALRQLGHAEEAIQSYDRALAIKSDYHNAWYERGLALHQLGRAEEAIQSYDRTLANSSDEDDAWYNRGVALGQLGHTEEAIQSYDRALAIKSDKQEAIYNKACCYALHNQVELALQFLRQAIQLNPDEYLEIFQTDSEFNGICNSPEFLSFLQEIKQ
jgi:tetratricopeptide (TPR) repeat protein